MKSPDVKLKLLSTLSDGTFHSGEELGEQIGISRAAISKHIKWIQEWGVDIFRVQGKGREETDAPQFLCRRKEVRKSLGERNCRRKDREDRSKRESKRRTE